MPFLPIDHQKLGLAEKLLTPLFFTNSGCFFSFRFTIFIWHALRTEIENATTFLLSIRVSISRSRWESRKSLNYYKDFTPRSKLRCFIMHRNDFSLFSPKLQSEFLLPFAQRGARFHGRAKTYADWVWYSSKIGELWRVLENRHSQRTLT